jgi:hypothetical protein
MKGKKMTKKITKILSFTLLATAMTVTILSPVYAQGGTRVPQETLNSFRQARCERVKERVDFRIRRYEDNKDRYIERYQKISDSVSNAIRRLESKGYDLNELKSDLEVLKSKRAEFISLHLNSMNALRSAKEIACENKDDRSVFESKVKEAQDYMSKSRAKAKEIHEFIRKDIRQDLQNLKNQAKEKNS